MQRGGLGADLLVYLSYMTGPPTCQPALSKEQGLSSDMGREHYRDVAESLIFGNQTLRANFVGKNGPKLIFASRGYESKSTLVERHSDQSRRLGAFRLGLGRVCDRDQAAEQPDDAGRRPGWRIAAQRGFSETVSQANRHDDQHLSIWLRRERSGGCSSCLIATAVAGRRPDAARRSPREPRVAPVNRKCSCLPGASPPDHRRAAAPVAAKWPAAAD